MQLKIAQVIGLNTDQKAAQVASVTRENDTFLAVLELISDDAFTKGRQVLSELEDFYFDSDGAITDKLNATFKNASEKLEDFHLCLGVVSGKILYLIGKGQVEAYLKRDGKLQPLLSVATPSQLISGFINPGDRLLLATSSLVTFLGVELDKSLDLPIEMFEEEIESKIGSSQAEEQGLAGLAVEVAEEDLEISSLPAQDTNTNPFPLDQAPKQAPAFPKVFLKLPLSLFKRLAAYFPKSNRGRLVVGVALLVIMLLGAGYQYKSSRDYQKQTQFNQVLQEAKDDFSGARGLASLSPTDAKNKLDSAKSKINQALVLKPNDSEAENLKKQVEQESSSILQQSSVADFPLFLDMDLVKKNFKAKHLSLSAGKLLLLDPEVKTLAVVDLTKKSNRILAGSDQLGEAEEASLNGEMAFVYSKDKGILRVDITNSKTTSVSKKDSDWGKIQDIYGFAGNVYAVDSSNKETPSNGQVWKYLPTADTYSDKREYFSKTTKIDLGSTLRMQIESSVYILKSGGEILRFTRGDKDNFSLNGLDKDIKDPKSIFVSSDTDNLYVLDSGNSRLLILTKTGSYKGQIQGGKFATASDLVVDEQGKKVYLLEGGKLFQVDLK